MVEEVVKSSEEKMKKSLEYFKGDLASLRTGRVSASIFDKILIDSYGSRMPLNQLANISIPEARQAIIQPWDKTILSAIEKALQSSDLGINPASDGNLIRLNFPALTEEKRKEIIKKAKEIAEESRVSIRNIRRESNEVVKKSQKESKITEDQLKKVIEDIQVTTDNYIKKIDQILSEKEKEILSE